MIASLDQAVGRILEALDEREIADDTLVWFFSDNGGAGDNRPLRQGKATVFEGGIRVAAAARWPDRIPSGRKVNAPIAYVDVLPRLMRIVGVEAFRTLQPPDGVPPYNYRDGPFQATKEWRIPGS